MAKTKTKHPDPKENRKNQNPAYAANTATMAKKKNQNLKPG
ncbi:MAG: hypothetical protein QM737_00090 [Ferruginibacter sp.]